MNHKIYLFGCIPILLSILITSCEPNKKIVTSDARIDKLLQENANTLSQLNDCNALVKAMNAQKNELQDENAYAYTQLKDLTDASALTNAELDRRLKSLQSVIQSQKDMMLQLKTSISDALMHYNSDELHVYLKDGNVYVTLEEKLLFKSGSDVVDTKGKLALKSLVNVLNSTKDISVMIEGHTDNVPIKTKFFEDNWDLSTARATSIVRIITKEYGFDSNRITASGRGKYHPIKTNETEVGRAANRRTEIILTPDLTELYKLLE